MKPTRVTLLALLLCSALTAGAEQTTVAVASNFSAAMGEIVKAFEQESGHQVVLTFGSSGKLYAQITNGAPFDAFLSADQAKPLTLEQQGQAVAGSRFTYALGTLMLWSSQPGFIDAEARVLISEKFNKLAIANPKLAPYGVAAVQALENLQLKTETESKWVQGENIAQTFQFVASGNAQLGFVAGAQTINAGGSTWKVPEYLYEPIRQDAVLLQRGKNNPATLALLQFIRGANAAEIIHRLGYRLNHLED